MLSKLSNSLRAGLVTAVFTFLTTFVTGATGWWQEVLAWVSTSGASEFPDVSVLGSAAAGALAAAVTGLLNYLYRAAQSQGLISGEGPTYT